MPSWDNPDIVSNDWRPFRLKKEARVTVRNLSATTPAINALVHYYTAPFGIGTRRQLRLTQVVNLGPGQQTNLLFPLHQEVLGADPRVGVHIRIDHPYDSNPLNNAGSQVHDGGYTSESGRDFRVAIPVVNDHSESRRIDLSLLPTNLAATLAFSSRVFAPFEQIQVELHIVVPAFLSGTPASPVETSATVVGRVAESGEVIGGITRLVRVDD